MSLTEDEKVMDDKHAQQQVDEDRSAETSTSSQGHGAHQPPAAHPLPNTHEINKLNHFEMEESLSYTSDGDPSTSLGGSISSSGSLSGSLNIRPPSEDSIIRRIRGFEDASELDLPMEQMHVKRGTDIGSILDKKYRIVHKIATGGMGVVFSAVHVKLGKQFAIKVIAPGTLTNEEAHRRFVREAKASTLLSSPHTVRVFDYNITHWGEPYLVMEYISGRNLRQLIKKDGPMDPERAIHVIKQIAKSLMEAHDHGLVHRDLKPSNVMLMQVKGHPDFVKIFDFGVVKFVTSPDDLDLTRQGAMLGTPRYMAPEQINSPENVGFGADIYSLGLLLYFILTGEKPYGELPSNAVVVQKLDKKGTLKLPKHLQLPRDLRTLYDKMTAFDPEKRPSTEDVYLKLDDLETELKVGTYSGSSAFLLPQQKSNRGFIALVIFLLALIGGLGWAFWPEDTTKKPANVNPMHALKTKTPARQGATPGQRRVSPGVRAPAARRALAPDAGRPTAPRTPKRVIPRPIKRPRRRVVRTRPRKRNTRSWKQRVRIVSSPRGARVIQGGKVLGTTPLTITKARNKSITLKLKKSGHFSKTVVIPKRARSRFSFRLKEIRIEMP